MNKIHFKVAILLFVVVRAKPIRHQNNIVNSHSLECQHAIDHTDITIFLSISPLADRQENNVIWERKIEINWSHGQTEDDDKIFLLPYYPESCSLDNPVLEITPGLLIKDWIRTNISFPRYERVNNDSNSICKDFWVAYVRNNVIMATDCIKVNPSWMSKSSSIIGPQKIRDILIPGTHDSGAYSFIDSALQITTKYATTQEENIFNQLYFGIRYLDIRIQHLPNTTELFWTHHGPITYRPVKLDIQQVKDFLDISKDIVIFDIHGITINTDKYPEANEELKAFLKEEFNGYMLPRNLTWEATFNDLWLYRDEQRMADKGGVIVTYNNDYLGDDSMLWEAVNHKWGNTNQVDDLKIFLDAVMEQSSQGLFNYAWSAMSQLTPTTVDIIGDTLNGLRGAADLVNRNVNRWLHDEWLESANIVAMDFFLGSNVVDICIFGNKIRHG
ncbi:PI-PLC X domain-containing protein 1-like [Artemia franciscana]|uniref:PI-PLC X domain-containing protein 1-like n=1 Tax=Artemia franciscana TaxID=6661 RepID=UPI0032DB3ED8